MPDPLVPLDFEPDEIFLPEYRNYLVYCDDTGINSAFYGWGLFWIPEEARGRLTGMVGRIRERHGYRHEIKWRNVDARSADFYMDLTSQFFQRDWMMFHALLVKRDRVDKSLHEHPGEGRLKHLSMMVRKKIAFFAQGCEDKRYHLRVDPLGAHSGYKKADEKLHRISDAMIEKELGWSALSTVFVRDSKSLTGIQLADFFLGAVAAPWQGNATNPHRLAVSQHVYWHLGWNDHEADTEPDEWKFNIWHFHPPRSGLDRYVRSRRVQHRFPVKAYRRR